MELTMATADNALFPLLHFVLDDLPTSTKSPELDDTHSRQILEPQNIKCNDMRSLIPLYLGYLCAVGFLDSPDHAALPCLENWKDVKGNLVGRSGA